MSADRKAPDGAAVEPALDTAATLFDLRTVIAVLFGGYGIVLTAMGLLGDDPAQLAKSAGIDMNLWTGIGMLILALGFLAWVRLRPPVVARPREAPGERAAPGAADQR